MGRTAAGRGGGPAGGRVGGIGGVGCSATGARAGRFSTARLSVGGVGTSAGLRLDTTRLEGALGTTSATGATSTGAA